MISPVLSLLAVAFPLVLGATFDVQVGAGGNLTYSPDHITANPGDIVNFHFNPKNHTVTQSAFKTPCVPLDDGFKTGFVPVSAGDATVMKSFTVSGTAPLWFYCGQTGHCGKGMVFAINAPEDPAPNSFSAFQALAIAQNGTATSSTPPAATTSTTSTTDTFTTPPAPQWTSATATVTWAGSTYTTTYSSYLGSPPPTPAAQPMDHKITVGADGLLAYSPANITASIGDTVTFEFHPKNHTVTQSSFLHPCEALGVTTGTPGFKSGFQPVAANATAPFPTFQIKINDTAPIWGYCGQVGHCAKGMVFAINAIESGPNNFANFQALAQHTGTNDTTATGTSPTPSQTGKSGAVAPGAVIPASFSMALAGLLALML